MQAQAVDEEVAVIGRMESATRSEATTLVSGHVRGLGTADAPLRSLVSIHIT